MVTESTIQRLALKEDIENFLYHEAELLDERRYVEWLDLLADDLHYWMPIRRNVKFGEQDREDTKPFGEMNWFDEGKVTLTQRVQQILTGVHWAEEPFSRVRHIISNVRITEVNKDEVSVNSGFLVYRNRVATETDFLVGKREDVLRKSKDGWLVARRKITLDQSVMLAKSITFFI